MSFRCGGGTGVGGNNPAIYSPTSFGISTANYNTAYSIGCYVFAEAVLTATQAVIFHLYRDWSEKDYAFPHSSGDGRLVLRVHNTGAVQVGVETAAGVLIPNQWHKIVMVRESATSLKLYVDDVLVATNTTSVASRLATGAAWLAVGSWNFYSGTGAGQRMLISGLRVANSTAWTAEQAAIEMSAFCPQTDSSCTSFLPLMPHSPRDVNSLGVDLLGGYSLNNVATFPKEYPHDPRHIPYWRQYAQGLVQS